LQSRGYRIVSGGTDNHLLVVDLRSQGLTGREAIKRLDPVSITVSKSLVPFDPETPFVTSGIRLGTPALTTRGMTEAAMGEVAVLIDRALRGDKPAQVRREVLALASRYPMP